MGVRFCSICKDYIPSQEDEMESICYQCFRDPDNIKKWVMNTKTRMDAIEAMEHYIELAATISKHLCETRSKYFAAAGSDEMGIASFRQKKD